MIDHTPASLLPERLRQVRDDAGMTQEEVGHYLGRSKNSISQFERGFRRPDTTTLVQYSRLFSVSTDYLLGLAEQRYCSNCIVMHMQGDSMSTLRIMDGDTLYLRPQSHASSGSIVLAEYETCQGIYYYLQQNGHHHYYFDTRTMQMLTDPRLHIIGVVERVEYKPGT